MVGAVICLLPLRHVIYIVKMALVQAAKAHAVSFGATAYTAQSAFYRQVAQ